MARRFILGAAVVPVLLIAACKGSDRSGSLTNSGVPGKAFGDSMVIRTTDGTMNLGLARDTVFIGLTDSVLAAAREDMARDTEETSSKIGRVIEKLVKKSVSSALQTKLKYPLADLDSATYSDGAIKFAYRNRRRMAFEDVKQNGHRALNSFDSTDAQQFVEQLNSAIRTERSNPQ